MHNVVSGRWVFGVEANMDGDGMKVGWKMAGEVMSSYIGGVFLSDQWKSVRAFSTSRCEGGCAVGRRWGDRRLRRRKSGLERLECSIALESS